MVLGKLSVPGRPTSLNYSRAGVYYTCRRCGWGIVWIFVLSSSILISFSFSQVDGPIQTEILPQRAAKHKTTNQSIEAFTRIPCSA